MTNAVIIIPARLHSTRLPRKLLLNETGKSVLEHTFLAANQSVLAARTIIATDHEDIVADARRFGADAVMTDPNAESGTDRVAEVAATLTDADIIVNVQGDEPELAPASIDQVIRLLANDPAAEMATLATPIRKLADLNDPNCVKVTLRNDGRAAYFSRSPIPHVRRDTGEDDERIEGLLSQDPPLFLQHLGLYAYRRDFLMRLSQLAPTPYERLEKLEQLRVLESGFAIQVGLVNEPSMGIDTAADYRAFVQRCA